MLDHTTASLPVMSEDIHDQFMAAFARAAEVSPTVELLDAMTAEQFTEDLEGFIEAGSEQEDDDLDAFDAPVALAA